MKKLSQKRKLWFNRIQKKREKNHKKRILKKKAIACLSKYEKSDQNHRYKLLKISGPKILGIRGDDNRKSLIGWLKKLRLLTLKNDQRILIDFTYSKDAEPIGFLLLLAEIDTILSVKGKNFIKALGPKDRVAAQLFHQIGLAKMLDIKSMVTITSDNVKFWRHINGSEIDADRAGKLIITLSMDYGFSDESELNLFRGVSEAMTNTIMHAYEYERGKNTVYGDKRWWMFVSLKNGDLTVVFCDIGIGIPRSLKNEEKHPGIYSKVINLLNKGEDSKLIKIALEEGRTKSDDPHRGLGMAEMKNLINGIGTGSMIIMSNRGAYLYHGKDKLESTRDFATSIMGTIVGWTAPIKALVEQNGEENVSNNN